MSLEILRPLNPQEQGQPHGFGHIHQAGWGLDEGVVKGKTSLWEGHLSVHPEPFVRPSLEPHPFLPPSPELCPCVPASPEPCPCVPPSAGCSRAGWRWSACASGTFTTTTTPSAACGTPAARSPPRTKARAQPVATNPWHLPVPHHRGPRALMPARGAPSTCRGFPGDGERERPWRVVLLVVLFLRV